MKILILSDLHLSNGDHFCVFGWNEQEFINIIYKIIKKHNIDKVILNGDIYELYKYKLKHIEKAYPKLTSIIKNDDIFFFIKGNHDSIYPSDVDHINIINSNNQIIHIEHGHKADIINGNVFGRLFYRICMKLLRILTRNSNILRLFIFIQKKLETFDEDLDRRKKYSVKYLEYAIKLLKRYYDVVILGHAHELRKHKFYSNKKQKLYFCTGTCTFKRFQGLIFDTETLKHTIIKDISYI